MYLLLPCLRYQLPHLPLQHHELLDLAVTLGGQSTSVTLTLRGSTVADLHNVYIIIELVRLLYVSRVCTYKYLC